MKCLHCNGTEQIFGILERIRGYTEQKKELQIKQSFLDKEIKRQHSLLDEILDQRNKILSAKDKEVKSQ